jgi:glutamate synthase (NADPH/NADH) small chain
VGGGNTAIDAAREVAMLGAAEVTMIYRRPAGSMSGYAHEMAGARLAGVKLMESALPVAVLRDNEGMVTGLRVASTADGAVVPGTERDFACDLVIVAIGQSKLRSLASQIDGVALDRRGCVVVDGKTRQTGNRRVFAGGDCINGGKEVVNAVADGRDAARAMMRSWAEGSWIVAEDTAGVE